MFSRLVLFLQQFLGVFTCFRCHLGTLGDSKLSLYEGLACQSRFHKEILRNRFIPHMVYASSRLESRTKRQSWDLKHPKAIGFEKS